jgi:hypothetical protein
VRVQQVDGDLAGAGLPLKSPGRSSWRGMVGDKERGRERPFEAGEVL